MTPSNHVGPVWALKRKSRGEGGGGGEVFTGLWEQSILDCLAHTHTHTNTHYLLSPDRDAERDRVNYKHRGDAERDRKIQKEKKRTIKAERVTERLRKRQSQL